MRNLFHAKATLTKSEVLTFLQRMEALEVDDWGWDDFINVPIKDDELDVIREECYNIWENLEYQEENSDGDYILNEKGLVKIRELIKKCAVIT